MNIQACALVLLAIIFEPVASRDSYSHCFDYAEYNTLVDLINHDECMNIDSVFNLLAEISVKENPSIACRVHVIDLLGGHFGSHARTPDYCRCWGTNRLQQYHFGSGDEWCLFVLAWAPDDIFSLCSSQYNDRTKVTAISNHSQEIFSRAGVSDRKALCISHDNDYRDLYNQFFVSDQSHDVPACRTHHSLWKTLKHIPFKDLGGGNSCQKDIIFHLKYAFEHNTDKCHCSKHIVSQHTHSPHGHQTNDHCHHLESFNKLQNLGDTDGCLSANSVWHYLDDLQVRNPACREKIQRYMLDKYKHATSKDGERCVCRERKPLVNRRISGVLNGSISDCAGAKGTYHQITTGLFTNIRADGCQNHNYLWSKLHGIHNYCTHYQNDHCTNYIDCTQDLIVRATIQYPNDTSDSCVCSKVTTSTTLTTPTSVATTQKPSTDTTAPSTTAPSITASSTTAPSTTETLPPASATSARVTRASTTVVTTQPTVPMSYFSCNKLSVVEDLTKSLHVTHPYSSPCDANAQGSDDAYVLSACNMTAPVTWRKGANVMADCESSAQQIPTYTPISTFNGDTYTPVGAQFGIFLGCYNNGIKMAIQKCNGVPEIIHVEPRAIYHNPRNYYVIV